MEILAKNTSKNKKVAELILQRLKEKNSNLLLLKGDLGSGKTTITQEIGKLLGVEMNINSPTFVIERIHDIRSEGTLHQFKKLRHIDLYRFWDKEEVENLGIFEELENKETLYIVEWPEIIEKDLNKNSVIVKIGVVEENSRLFKIN